MLRVVAVCAALGPALVLTGCLTSKPPARILHEMPECGIALELPSYFGEPSRSEGCRYQWSAHEGLTTFEISPVLPNDPGLDTNADTAMPMQTVDYAREAAFGGLPGRERRTQERLGARNRAVWIGFLEGPKGNLYLKLILVQEETADEFGEAFWRNLRTNLIRPLS